MRAESLRDGYDVSELCYDWCYSTQTLSLQCLEEIVFMPTVSDVLVRYMDGMTLVLLNLPGIFENLIRHHDAALRGQDIMT